MIFWGVFGFLGLLRAVSGLLSGEGLGIIFGLAWCGFGFWRAYSEAKQVDEQALGRDRATQPDRPKDR